jgi:hypothetical protein
MSRPHKGDAHATNIVGNELEAPKANGFTEGDASAHQALSIGSDDECG